MIGTLLMPGITLTGYGLYELNWWITRCQFPDLFRDDR